MFDGVDQKGETLSSPTCLAAWPCHRGVKHEWEASDEVSEEPNRIKPMRDGSRQRFPGRVEARRRRREMALVTGGKSEEIQADWA